MKKTEHITALIVGAGAVENAWKPVLKALQPHFPMPLTSDGANAYLARFVYLLRWWSAVDTELGKKSHAEVLKGFKEIREAIASEIMFSQKSGEIRQRPELLKIFDQFIANPGGKFILVSTNWDTVVETAIHKHLERDFECSINTIHIHGVASDPTHMYLPTEVTKEPYRTKDEDLKIGGLHGSTWKTLETATRVVVYGHSLSPLDAELCQILACGWSSHVLKEIIVVDPRHEEVAQRINVLLDRRFSISVWGMSPGSLDQRVDYTVRPPASKHTKKT